MSNYKVIFFYASFMGDSPFRAVNNKTSPQLYLNDLEVQ
jgi:hypothetical protein